MPEYTSVEIDGVEYFVSLVDELDTQSKLILRRRNGDLIEVPVTVPKNTFVEGTIKITSGPIRPVAPSPGDIHVMEGPDFNPITMLPWETFFLADRLGLADGAKVAQWNDESVNARHAVQATLGLQPNFRRTVAKLGERAAVEFTSSAGTYLRTPEWTVGTAQPNTIVAVGRIGALSQCLWDTANVANVQRLSIDSAGNWNMKGSTAATLSAVANFRPHCFVCVYNGVTSSLRIDGVQVAFGDAGGNSLRGLTLGARNDLGVPTSGYLGCHGVITDTLTADQLAYFEWWARNYYKMQWAG